jgi:hypothetical protein
MLPDVEMPRSFHKEYVTCYKKYHKIGYIQKNVLLLSFVDEWLSMLKKLLEAIY